MNCYREITLLPQDEAPAYFLWSKLYRLLHPALAGIKDADGLQPVGAGFPDYVFDRENDLYFPGEKLRLFASDEQILLALDLPRIFAPVRDYLHITNCRPVPESRITGYAVFSRRQVKSGAARLVRRRLKQDPGLSEIELFEQYSPKTALSPLPFITLDSGSTGQRFKLFIEKKTADAPCPGRFGTYGLSPDTTVPEF